MRIVWVFVCFDNNMLIVYVLKCEQSPPPSSFRLKRKREKQQKKIDRVYYKLFFLCGTRVCVISRVSVMYNRRGDAGRVFCPFNFFYHSEWCTISVDFFFAYRTGWIKINFYYKRNLNEISLLSSETLGGVKYENEMSSLDGLWKIRLHHLAAGVSIFSRLY